MLWHESTTKPLGIVFTIESQTEPPNESLTMYTVTWTEAGQLFTISSPSLRHASRAFYGLRVKAGKCARLWFAAKGKTMMIF